MNEGFKFGVQIHTNIYRWDWAFVSYSNSKLINPSYFFAFDQNGIKPDG